MLYNDAYDRVTMNILTSFPFTFKLTVPGLSNPFTSLTTTPSPTSSKNIPIPPGDPPLDRPSRSLIRPTRPLPISVTAPTPMSAPGSRTMRPPRSSFSPSPSPTPSSALSLTQTYSHLGPRPHFVHSLSPSPAPINRKRGWEPSCSPTTSETTLTLTNGYLDTPAKYRELTGGMEREAEHIQGVRELDEDDLPPTKRRRGLAGSIVSTAWSAALIGTAVGLTVYKLWRNRGAQDESGHVEDSKIDEMVVENERTPEPPSPPPPYNQEWTAIDYPQQQQHLLTPRGREKARQRVIPRSARKPRRERLTVPRKSATTGRSSASSSRPPIPPEFDFESPRKRGRSSYGANAAEEEEPHDQADDPDDKMDWIGGKLAQLIEEGKKALGKEVVVMSDAKEDEVDDGSGAWVSDEEDRGRLKRRGSTRSRRSMTFTNGHGVYPSTSSAVSSSSSGNLLAPPTAPTTPRKTHSRGFSHDGMGSPGLSVSAAAHEEPSNWESPEIREMMERARAKYASRAGR